MSKAPIIPRPIFLVILFCSLFTSVLGLKAQQLDATFSLEPGLAGNSRLKMVLNQPATFQFSESLSSATVTIIIKNVYNSVPSGSTSTASGLTHTTSTGKSGAVTQMGTYLATFGSFIHTTDEEITFSLSAGVVTGETMTFAAGTVIQNSPGNYSPAQTFNAGPYTAVISNGAFTGTAATMVAASDNTPPVFENSTPSQSSITQTGFALATNIDEAGTIYYVVVANDATAPTAANVKAGQASGAGTPVTSGNAAVTTGGFSNSFTVTGLSAGTAYDVYVVAQDDEGSPNLQTSPTKIDVTTAAPSSLLVAATVFLEGAYNGTALTTSINGSIPTTQPYSTNGHSGGSTGSIPAGVVDWVLVELREAGSAATALNNTRRGSSAGFLMSDGTIKATDGISNLSVSLSGNSGTDYFVVIYHRNHLPIMSANAVAGSSGTLTIDFTSSSATTFQTTTALVSLSGGKFGMPAGDTNDSGTIDATDLSTWSTSNGLLYNYSGNGASDFNLDGVINAVDRNDFHQKNTSKTRQVPST